LQAASRRAHKHSNQRALGPGARFCFPASVPLSIYVDGLVRKRDEH